ncbi:uncharacterized protein LOC118432548 [Branchiostoma floridae]|uniref:Uncharacterized protein LOC118432548 n=1 Tax=Branchiostoma floridae TaxID=7739 RepID=A0A9J7MI39_BRAFL|nr:uncharacterized protein LOC118432548 [Branchiostoma floridae]
MMQDVRDKVSGGAAAAQMKAELQLHPRDELQQMLQELKLDRIVIPNGHLLAAKVGVGMSWSQIRKLKRWLGKYNIKLPSEKISREIAAEQISGFDITAEKLPFSVRENRKDPFTVQLRPCAYVTSLKDTIFSYLDKNKEANMLTWHGKIPEDEVWVKLGGDHGGESFKMIFQVLNRDHPNSKDNTNVFCIFNAKDSRENLTLALQRYTEEIRDLQVSKWTSDGKEYKLKILATGDYAFLCTWYGLSGACGFHPCLWCYITLHQIPEDRENRPLRIPKRTLDSLAADHQRFVQEGMGKLKKAKEYNNAIAPVMFNVPIDQVMVPGLHIGLGLYKKLFEHLEADLQDIDLKLQSYLESVLAEGEVTKDVLLADEHLGKFKSFVAAIDEARALDDAADVLEDQIEEQESQLAWLAYRDGVEDSMAEVVFNEACSMVQDLFQQKETLRAKADAVRNKASVKTGKGPLTSQLDPKLKEFKVRRQEYHGKSFIGNHVHKMLKENAINELTSIVVTTINEILEKFPDLPLSLVPKAHATAEKHKQLFTLFAQCHKKYSHADLMDAEAINELGKNSHKNNILCVLFTHFSSPQHAWDL